MLWLVLILRAIWRWPSLCSKCSRSVSLIFLMDFRFPGNFDPLSSEPIFAAYRVKSSAAVFFVLLSFRSLFSHPDHLWRGTPKGDRNQKRMVIAFMGER